MFPATVTYAGTAANLLGEGACTLTNKDAAPGRLVGHSGISGLLLAAVGSESELHMGVPGHNTPFVRFFPILQRRLCRNASLTRQSTRQPIVDCVYSL